MNPYNQKYPYNYEQHTPGPPQPQWQGPPRRQGWFDPRMPQEQPPQQSPVSPYNAHQFSYPPPPPPPLPPPPTQSPRPQAPHGSYDTSSWGVKYNQDQAAPQWHQPPQSEEYRPPLPPRPSSSTAHHATAPGSAQIHHGPSPQSAEPHHGPPPQSVEWHHGPPPQSAEWHHGPSAPSSSSIAHSSQPPSSWQESPRPQSQVQSYEIPPPPPPRPPQYEAQIQSQHQQDGLSHQHYSHQHPSHQYDPQTPQPQTLGYNAPQYGPGFVATSPPPNMAYASTDPALVSPIEPETHDWSQHQVHESNASNLQAPRPESRFYSSALGTGGPSDWEHFGVAQNVSPQTSSSPPVSSAVSVAPIMSSPPQMPASAAQPTTVHDAYPKSGSQDLQQTSQSPHRDSDVSSVPTLGINRTGTIDSVILAWNKPVDVSGKTSQQPDSRSESRGQAQTPPPERVIEVEKVVEKIVDPYDDLEPEFKASLKRYAVMLRKEAAADTDESKFDIFQSFIKKELRLRSMLYGVESQIQNETKQQDAPTFKNATSPSQSLTAPKDTAAFVAASAPSVASNSMPILANSMSASRDPSQIPPPAGPEKPMGHEGTNSEEKQASLNTLTKTPMATHPITSLPPLNTTSTESAGVQSRSKDDSFVIVNAGGDEVDYSPGGRPRIRNHVDDTEFSPGGRPCIARPQVITGGPKHANGAQSIVTGRSYQTSPSADAPMVLEDYVMAGPPSPGASAPIVIEPISATDLPQVVTADMRVGSTLRFGEADRSSSSKRPDSVPSIKFEPPRPAYAPFKYNPTVQAPTQPADQSYSSLRKDAADSGRLLGHEPTSAAESLIGSRTSSPGPSRPQDEAFIGLIRSQSKAVRPKKLPTSNLATIPQLRPGTPRASTPSTEPTVLEESGLAVVTAALKSMLPKTVPDSYGLSKHPKATSLKAQIDNFPDNFSFIHEAVIAWDRKNRELHKKLDEQRNARQADSEAHIDGMFNDNEIGYADIGDLEAEFKLAEAERKYQEDQQELESFTTSVYQPVQERLQKEALNLNAQYTFAVALLDVESEPASRCLKLENKKAETGFVMSCVLSLFNKLELRHQKLAEADVERERRRKRLELTVLYTNGDTQGVKKLEQEFAVAEKMQVLHEARAKDTRANKLMDSFDRATVRGLGDNQTYVDDLLVRIREVKELVLKDPSNIPQEVYAPQSARDMLSLAQKAVDFVLADSQKLLTLSNVADKMLNDADYGVSVAEARASSADAPVYDKLAAEKEKEDVKIVEDTNLRMSSISKAPEEAIALIREVMDKIGDDAEHQDRLKKSLEVAKQRNAAADAGG